MELLMKNRKTCNNVLSNIHYLLNQSQGKTLLLGEKERDRFDHPVLITVVLLIFKT